MSVDVFDSEWGQLFRQRGTHHRMTEGAKAADWGRAALPQQGPQQLPKTATIGGQVSNGPHQFIIGKGLEK
jgi:hypothetical protein